MDAGRQWALETFGRNGPTIWQQLGDMIRSEHEALVDAQEASGHRSHGVYGQFWQGILEKVESFGRLPGASLVRPGDAPYKVPVVNGVALFPWRYAKTREAELVATRFGTSDARREVTRLRPAVQEVLDFDLPDQELTEEDKKVLATVAAAVKDPVISSGRFVLVAIASSVNGLFKAECGEVELSGDGFLQWVAEPKNLLASVPTKPASTSPTATFTDGTPPRRFPRPEDATGHADE
jgi:hypothetical protein